MTAYNQPTQPFSLKSNADYSDGSCMHRFFDVNTSGKMVRTGAGGRALGINSNKPEVDDPGEQWTGGIQVLELGGSATAGDSLKSDSTGRGVTAAAAAVAAGQAHAILLETGVEGDLVPVYLMPAASLTMSSGTQTLTGAGAVDLVTARTEWVATTDNATLAAGLYVGQRKTIRAATGTTGSNVLTPATVSADAAGGVSPATVTYTTEGQETEWEWYADGWKLVRIQQAGVGAVTAAGTINPLHITNHATVDGTDVVTLPNGYYPGQEVHIVVIAATTSPVLDVGGLFYLEAGTATGVNVTFDAAAVFNWMRGLWTGARWQIAGHLNANVE